MRRHLLIAIALFGLGGPAAAQGWQRYQVPSSGTRVEIPTEIFSEDAGAVETGAGRHFVTADHRADLTVQSVPNAAGDTPAAFLAKSGRRPASSTAGSRRGSSWSPACATAGSGTTAATAAAAQCIAC
ncbi:MAG TPA: hypothetical protein VGC77_07690 [Rhodopseudomonas sp.]|uniref:hypothetical protein n=1 Tax=Rhodopseudomonas sp. TaxID=1078 RepID=UPI002EDA0610